MAEATPMTFFITGTTRGLGLALVTEVAAKYPSAIIYAGARDPDGCGAAALRGVADKYPGRVEIVTYVAADAEGNKAIAQQIGRKHGRVDVVIANAAMCGGLAPVHELDVAQFTHHFLVNVTGPIILFQALRPLLQASPNPKFIPITSIGGSLAVTPALPLRSTCYCAGKAALNWVGRKVHFENEWLVCFPLAPGSVHTDMLEYVVAHDATRYMKAYVDREGARSAADAARALVDIVLGATREGEGGQFVDVDGGRLPW